MSSYKDSFELMNYFTYDSSSFHSHWRKLMHQEAARTEPLFSLVKQNRKEPNHDDHGGGEKNRSICEIFIFICCSDINLILHAYSLSGRQHRTDKLTDLKANLYGCIKNETSRLAKQGTIMSTSTTTQHPPEPLR